LSQALGGGISAPVDSNAKSSILKKGFIVLKQWGIPLLVTVGGRLGNNQAQLESLWRQRSTPSIVRHRSWRISNAGGVPLKEIFKMAGGNVNVIDTDPL
jgi:hypothetical protein